MSYNVHARSCVVNGRASCRPESSEAAAVASLKVGHPQPTGTFTESGTKLITRDEADSLYSQLILSLCGTDHRPPGQGSFVSSDWRSNG